MAELRASVTVRLAAEDWERFKRLVAVYGTQTAVVAAALEALERERGKAGDLPSPGKGPEKERPPPRPKT